jgi:hypothetical protein
VLHYGMYDVTMGYDVTMVRCIVGQI